MKKKCARKADGDAILCLSMKFQRNPTQCMLGCVFRTPGDVQTAFGDQYFALVSVNAVSLAGRHKNRLLPGETLPACITYNTVLVY